MSARSERVKLARRPIDQCDPSALLEELVEDAVAGYATPLDRFVRACEKIGQARGIGAEGAYRLVRAEVTKLTGMPFMPMIS